MVCRRAGRLQLVAGPRLTQHNAMGTDHMKNKLADLNNHLFAQLERLGEEGLSTEQIADEVKRADAITDVADSIIRNVDVQLKAVTLIANHGDRFKPMLGMIEGPKE